MVYSMNKLFVGELERGNELRSEFRHGAMFFDSDRVCELEQRKGDIYVLNPFFLSGEQCLRFEGLHHTDVRDFSVVHSIGQDIVV